ncbi:MAG: carbohydrate-binding domain-containing protein [Treponema sp.]|nr:carbohydrate-binding domain-containing protein [Treponema sp.]
MKKTLIFISALFLTGLAFSEKITIDGEGAKKSFSQEFSISPKDSTVSISKDKIILAPKKEGTEYKISGYFNGQIINKTKNTVLKLKDAYLENTSGQAAVYGEAKTEISTSEGSKNYIVSSGASQDKTAAIQCKKNLELGGSGNLYVLGNVYHAVKGDDVKLKGSGNFYLQGTKEGSAINCENLISERGKTFHAYLLNSKNGAKADFVISIASGNFHLYDNKTGLKTDTNKDDPKNPHAINLTGGTIYSKGNQLLYKTEEKSYKARGVKIVEE